MRGLPILGIYFEAIDSCYMVLVCPSLMAELMTEALLALLHLP